MSENRNRSNLILGIILIAAGLMFLLSRLFNLSGWGDLWPFIIIFIGAAFFAGMVLGGRQTGALAIPGSIVLTVGLILLVQNWFDRYETWAYSWALIIAAVGVGQAINGAWSGDENTKRNGLRVARQGLLLFVIFGAVMEFIFRFTGVTAPGREFFWPALLILAGAVMLISRAYRLVAHKAGLSWEDRDLFWPVLIIGFGLLWVLVNLGQLPFENISALFGLWPLLLIAAGVDVLLGRRWPWLGALLGFALVGAVLWLSFNSDRLQLSTRLPWAFGEISGSGERVSGSGKIVTETYDVRGFDSIELSAGGVAEIVQGETEGLTVEVDDNLLEYLDIDVAGDTLRIRTRRDYSLAPSGTIRYIIQVRDLEEISVSGSGQVEMDGLTAGRLALSSSGLGSVILHNVQADALRLDISGSGSAKLDGTMDTLEISISGSGDLQGQDLQVRRAVVSISGSGKAILWVTESLDADISGAGVISYYGSPQVDQQVSGVGKVEKLGDK